MRRRRVLGAALLLLLLLALTEAGFALHGVWLRTRWESIRDAELRTGLARVVGLLKERERRAAGAAREIAAEVSSRGLLDRDDPLHRVELFRALTRRTLAPGISGVAVLDGAGVPVAFEGKTFEFGKGEAARASGILRSRIYRVLYAAAPIGTRAGATIGTVVVFSPYDVNFPLHNRYLRSGDFEEDVSRRLGLRDIDITRNAPKPLARAARDDTRLGGVLENEAGETIAWLNVQVFPLEVHLARSAHTRRGARAVILAVLLLVLGFGAARAALRPAAPLRYAAALIGAAFLVRVGIYQAGFPELVATGPAFDPAGFSMPVTLFDTELGLLFSPGDFVLTGAFLLFVTAVLVRIASRRAKALLEGGRRPGLALLLAVPAAALAVVGYRGWLALLHALTFDSTVQFFAEHSVVPDAPATLLFLGLLLVTLSLLLVTAAAVLLPLRLLLPGRPRSWILGGLTAAGLAGAVALPGIDLRTIGAIATGLAGTAAILSRWPHPGLGIRLAALTGLASVLAFYPLIREVWMETRADVEEEAEILFDPAQENPLRHLFESDLSEVAEDERLVERLAEDPEKKRSQLAFRLWAEGPLSRRPRGTKVTIVDRTGGRILSSFEIDMPRADWLPDPLPGASADETAVWELDGRGEGFRQTFLVGQAPVLGEGGKFLGQVVVRMPMERPTLGTQPRPEILRSYEGETMASEVRELHYSEFDGERLVRSTSPDFPRVLRADPRTRAILEGRVKSLWIREDVAGRHWMSLYRPRVQDGRVTGLKCVSFPSGEQRDLFLSFFKLLLVNALAAFAAVLLVTVARIRRFVVKFQHKLLVSYLVVSAVPLLLLAQMNRSVARETVESQMLDSLRRASWLVRGELRDRGILDALGERLAKKGRTAPIGDIVSNEDLKEIGYRLGQEVNLFVDGAGGGWGAPLVASSEPGIFETELFSDHLSGRAYLDTVILGREFSHAREMVGSYSYLVGHTPLVVPAADGPDRVAGAISLPMIYGQDAVDRELARRNSMILAVYLLILLVVVFIGMVLARRISSPIESLATATQRVAAGDLDYRIPGRPGDEFGYLVDSFNRMTEDLRESRERIVRAEKDAAWREMAKQVAHEIKNPLTPMRLSAQQILRAHEDEHEDFDSILHRGLDTIIRQSESLARIASEFGAFARLPTRKPEPVDLADLARQVAGLYGGAEGIEVSEEIGPVPPVLADRDEIRRVLVNLMSNAVQAMEGAGGTLTVRTSLVAARFGGEERTLVEVAVADTGVGIPEGDRERLFMPNFSTKTGGTGLGLAISKAVVETFGGHIAVESEVGAGTTVTVHLPPAGEESTRVS